MIRILIGGLLFAASAAEAAPVRLGEVRAHALAARPELRGQAARVAAAEARVREADAADGPRLEATVDGSVSPGSKLVSIGEGNDEVFVSGSPAFGQDGAFVPRLRYGAMLGLDWALFDFGRSEAATRAAEAESEARRAELASTRADLVRAVDGAYLQWLGAFARWRSASVQQAYLRSELEEGRRQVEDGLLAPSDLHVAEAELVRAELRLAYAEETLQRARHAVADASGMALEADAEPDLGLLELGAPPEREAASVSSTEVGQARLRAARASAEAKGADGRPVLAVSAKAGLRGQEGEFFPVYQGQVGLRIPIWDGGLRSAREEGARADALALEARLQALEADERRSTRDRALALRSARKRVELAERYLQIAELRRQDVRARREEGEAASDAERSARAELDRAEAELLTARLDRAAAALGL